MKDVTAEFHKVLADMTDTTADIRALNARLDERRKLNAIVIAYELALGDPNTKIPTYLHAAIEQARVA